MKNRIEIQTYKGEIIFFDIETELFFCVMLSENSFVQTGKTIAGVKNKIDAEKDREEIASFS